jgi:hypothetical protein
MSSFSSIKRLHSLTALMSVMTAAFRKKKQAEG